MANGYNNIDQAYILPSTGLSDAQKLNFLQNSRQLEEDRQQRLADKQQQNEWKNLNLIQGDLDFQKYQTGEQAIDNYAQSELKKINDEALKNHIDENPAQLEFWLQQQLQPLTQWHTMAKGTYAQLDKTLQDYNKTYPNIDYSKARDLVLNQFQNDFLDVDQNGNVTRKNTDQIRPSDYAGFLQKPDVLGFINNDTSPFDKFFQTIPKVSVGSKDYTNKAGHVKEFGWSGMMPEGIGEIVTDEDNRPTSIQMRGDIVPSVTDAQGNPMKTLPDDIMQRLKGNPSAYAAALGKWQQVKPQIEQSFIQRTGKGLTPDIENQLMSSYLYDQANKLIAHDLKTEEKQATPKYTNVTNINVGQKPAFDYNTTGVEFDRIGNVHPLNFNNAGVKISNGLATDKNGNPFSGENLVAKVSDLPQGLLSVLKSGGIVPDSEGYASLKIDNGRIEAIKFDNGSWIDRQDLYNYQLQNNSEPLKAPQKQYGNKNNPNANNTQQSTSKKKIAGF